MPALAQPAAPGSAIYSEPAASSRPSWSAGQDALRHGEACLAHAECPVLAIPPPALARELGHIRLAWQFWHRTVTPERVLRNGGTAA